MRWVLTSVGLYDSRIYDKTILNPPVGRTVTLRPLPHGGVAALGPAVGVYRVRPGDHRARRRAPGGELRRHRAAPRDTSGGSRQAIVWARLSTGPQGACEWSARILKKWIFRPRQH